MTRYDIVDEEYDSINSQFVIGQKDVNIVEHDVVYDEVTTTRDNYITLNKLCPTTKYRDAEEHYIENVQTTRNVNIADFEEEERTRDVTTYQTETYQSYINKRVTVCDSSSDDHYGDSSSSSDGYGGYGHGWASSSSDDCHIVWKRVPVSKSRQVPVVHQESYIAKVPVNRVETITSTEQVPRVRIVQESYTENEACTETINHPTTSTNQVPRTVLRNRTKQVPVTSIQNTLSKKTRGRAVARQGEATNY